MKQSSRRRSELFWPRVVLRKWLNITARDSDFSADSSGGDDDDDNDTFCDATGTEEETPRLIRRNSETFRTQYIDKKEIRICVGTWNVGGKVPPNDLDIDQWLDISEPADIYVLGLQEIVPLNAGNIFGPEDSRPVLMWENIIRKSLNRVRPTMKYKSFSYPPSPSKFRPSDDAPDIEDEISLSIGDEEEEVHPLEEEPYGIYEVRDKTTAEDGSLMDFEISNGNDVSDQEIVRKHCLQKQFSSSKRVDGLRCFQSGPHKENKEPATQPSVKQCKLLSGTERLGLSWPEPPMNLLGHHALDRNSSFGVRPIESYKVAKSFKAYNSFKLMLGNDHRGLSVTDLDLGSLIYWRRRPGYVRIVSKQMVGIFLTIWVRRGLRKHIQNLKVSTVGVGVMGYIGNKGSVSVSMSIYQTLFCFICSHLTSGEKEGDELKRNANVDEIHRRTNFHPVDQLGFPKNIHDHERLIWLGDLNYRINLPYHKILELTSKQQWSKLLQKDQLTQELKEGHAFEGWSEGTLDFPPTYKYELNSEKYHGEDPKAGKRNPAWCDRILSYGNGINLREYKRAEIQLSDHRPVTAIYIAEVECFCARKLQRALTFTDAEIGDQEMVIDEGTTLALSHSRLNEYMPGRETRRSM